MKLTKTTVTALTVIVASLITSGVVVCLKTSVNYRSLVSPKNRIGEDMRKMEHCVKKEDLDKASGRKGEANQCSGTKKEKCLLIGVGCIGET